MIRTLTVILIGSTLSGCANLGIPKTLGETSSSYGYVPLDPLPVDQAANSDSCELLARAATAYTAGGATPTVPSTSVPDPYLKRLPDQTIRFAVASFDASGSLTFGPSKLTTKNGQYRAVLDYIQADAVPVEFYIRKLIAGVRKDGVIDTPARAARLSETLPPGYKVVGYDVVLSKAETLARNALVPASDEERASQQLAIEIDVKQKAEDNYTNVAIPVYVGVGLRLTADILSLKGGVTLAGLGAIGADAESDKITGTLTVQALGVSGKAIATALPLPSKLDQTTIENAILSVGNMRATLYATPAGSDGVWVQPRVVGLYSPIGSSPTLINAIYSELSRSRPRWHVPCG